MEQVPGSGIVISLIPIAPEHFSLVAAWLSNPEINRWLIAEWRGRTVDPSILAMVVRSRKNVLRVALHDGRPCAITGLYDIEPADRCAAIWGLMGDRTLEGKGVMSRALAAMCREGFDHLHLNNIYGWIMECNERSRRLAERVGFREIGRMRGAAVFEGRTVDRVYVDLTPADLAAAEAARTVRNP